MIRTLLGIEFLIRDTTKFESAVTTITERPITKAPFICTVTANEEQIPSTRTVIGLPLRIGFNIVSLSFAFILFPPHYLAIASESAETLRESAAFSSSGCATLQAAALRNGLYAWSQLLMETPRALLVMEAPEIASTALALSPAPPFTTWNASASSKSTFFPSNSALKEGSSLILAPRPGVSLAWSKYAPRIV